MPKSLIVNRCDYCGKFKKWESLYEEQHWNMGISGEIQDSYSMICSECEDSYAEVTRGSTEASLS